MEATSDGRVIEETFVVDKDEQLWKKGNPDAEGYFTIESQFEAPKFLTAITKSDLEIKGNIIDRLRSSLVQLCHVK